MDKLTKLEKLAVTPTTDNSVSLHIVDSADYPVLDFGMSGKTEQFSGTIQTENGEEVTVPSPDYPQEIVNAGVLNEDVGKYKIECRIANENLFDESLIDKTSSLKCSVVLDFVEDAQIYVIQNDIEGTAGIIAVRGIVERGELKDDEIVVIKNVAVTKTFKADLSKYDYYILRYYEPNKNGIHNIMITHQSKMNGYLPHKSQVFVLTSPVPLTKWDKLVKRDGVWGCSIYHQHYVINGTYDWRVYGDGNRRGFSANCLDEVMSRRDGYSNQLQVDSKGLAPVELRNHIWIGVNNSYVYTLGLEFYNNDLEDKGLANWKKHLNENPLDIWTYRTREIAFHPLPDEEQSLLNNLETYYGVTNAYNDQGCPMWVKYVADTQLYIDNKLANTQALILES